MSCFNHADFGSSSKNTKVLMNLLTSSTYLVKKKTVLTSNMFENICSPSGWRSNHPSKHFCIAVTDASSSPEQARLMDKIQSKVKIMGGKKSGVNAEMDDGQWRSVEDGRDR